MFEKSNLFIEILKNYFKPNVYFVHQEIISIKFCIHPQKPNTLLLPFDLYI